MQRPRHAARAARVRGELCSAIVPTGVPTKTSPSREAADCMHGNVCFTPAVSVGAFAACVLRQLVASRRYGTRSDGGFNHAPEGQALLLPVFVIHVVFFIVEQT
jgi:hypothetical protein